ncbi:MAG: hypothetical protein F4149_01130, partial [Gammaproteobacteria bacterium]|nr:hypothetical protein [Gammaproteobacteria bacterium]
AQSGEVAASGATGARTVTVPTSGSVAVEVATDDDGADEPDGSVSVTVKASAAYTVSSAHASASVTVRDNDDAPPTRVSSCVSDDLLATAERLYEQNRHRPPDYAENWFSVLVAFGARSPSDWTADARAISPMTSASARSRGWSRFATALECIEGAASDPEVSVSAGSAVTEGGKASFTVTASPAPSAPLDVKLTVAQSGDVAASGATGSRTVTVPTGGSIAVEVATDDDSTDEPDGSVSVTVKVGAGYAVASAQASATVAVRDNDDPSPDPEVSVSAGGAVTEGGKASFTVSASPAPSAPLDVTITVAQTGDVAASGATGSRTVTVPTSGGVAVEVATEDDSADEPDGSVSVTVNAGSGYALASAQASATVAVRDNDDPSPDPEVSVSAGGAVTEGGKASFTVSASPAPSAPLDVTITVAQTGDVAASGATGSRTVTVPTSGSVAVEVATQDDSADEPDGSVSLTVKSGAGYAVSSAQSSATVTVRDNDDPAPDPETPTFSVDDATANESDGFIWFTVRLSAASDKLVTVRYRTRESTPVSARRNRDYLATNGTRTFAPEETTQRFRVRLYNDGHDEDPETFEVVLSDAQGAEIADGVAVGTIVNTDPMPAAWLGRFGRAVAEQALDGIENRLGARRGEAESAHAPGFRGTIGWLPIGGRRGGPSEASTQPDVGDAGAFALPAGEFHHGGAPIAHGSSATGDLGQLLLGSQFTYTGEQDGNGGVLGFWGRGSQARFDAREGALGLDGEVTTAMLGADYARSNWLAGMALTRSRGSGGFRGSGAVADAPAMDGAIRTTLTAAIPYASWRASERLEIWSAAGYGVGETTLETETAELLEAQIDWTLATAGIRSDIFTLPGGASVAWVSDALWARTASDRVDGLAAADSSVSRLRLGL